MTQHLPLVTRRSALAGAAGLAGAAVAGTALAPAAQAADWTDLVVVTANIGRKNLSQREPGIRAVRYGVTRHGETARPLVGFQEIGEGDPGLEEIDWIRGLFGGRFEMAFNNPQARSRRVPVVVPHPFTIVGRRDSFVHEGRKNVTPPRFINEVLIAHKSDPSLRVAVLNTHYVAGAWNADTSQGSEKWRRDRWNEHYDRHRKRVAAYHARGIPVVWTGDVNRDAMPKVHRKERRVFGRGIDQIGWVPGTDGTSIRLRDARVIDMAVDSHNARVGVFQVRRG
ncbi:hypothetical protein GCM10023340_24180 [Nocardioides marinquilinus]|uniref:Endonuclease/exonuclease/phosphatase family protein n=1 Tax=Nocardioides marinquilinus TaxID=1210400 RepID=A0ABP9PMX5_9ACTN